MEGKGRDCFEAITAEDGAVLTEAMFAYLILFAALIAGIELVRLGHVLAAGQFLVNKGARSAMIGSTQDGLSREQSVMNEIVRRAATLGIQLSDQQITICAPEQAFSCPTPDARNPGELVHVGVEFPVRVFNFDTNIPLRFGAVVKNEPV